MLGGLWQSSILRGLSRSSACAAHGAAIARGFHTTSQCEVSEQRLKRLRRLYKHVVSKAQKDTQYVDPILGKAKTPFIERIQARVAEPYNQVSGRVSEETSKLVWGARQALVAQTTEVARPAVDELENRKLAALERIVSMQNASSGSSKPLAVKYAIEEFQRFPGDTGSSEVQAAVLTMKIQYVVKHVKEHKKDNIGLSRLRQLVQDRQGVLKYLRRANPERYWWTIEKLGLSDEAATAEFALSREYFEKVQFFGDRTVPRKRTMKEIKKERREKEKIKKAKRFLESGF
jgi:small subunit ribosomal protein S15